MARPRKFVNTSDYPDFVIELVARTFYEDMVADVLKETAVTDANVPCTVTVGSN